MYEAYGTYVDDKYFDNHDHDDDTDEDTDDDTDDNDDNDVPAWEPCFGMNDHPIAAVELPL